MDKTALIRLALGVVSGRITELQFFEYSALDSNWRTEKVGYDFKPPMDEVKKRCEEILLDAILYHEHPEPYDEWNDR